jgi:hypothetical protein
MTQYLGNTLSLKRPNEQTIPVSPAEIDMNAFPNKYSTMKPPLTRLPSSLMMLPTVQLCSGSLVSEASLGSLMASKRTLLQNMHKKFAEEIQLMDRPQANLDCIESRVTMEESSSTEDCDYEPALKRRRYQRRNSKTPAMMLSSVSSIVGLGLDELDEASVSWGQPSESETFIDSDPWDGTLKVAEELVRQLKLHRKSLGKRSLP